MKRVFLIIRLVFVSILLGQTPDSTYRSTGIESKYFLKDVVITGTRINKQILDVPQFVQLLTKEDILIRKNFRTMPEMLKENSGIMVQNTGHGQGSPYLRGFTGFRTVFLIDGIRLNNSVFRDGPNQYWSTVDPLSINKIEIVKGINSTLYGSDAIGGIVAVLTREMDFKTKSLLTPDRFYTRLSSAEHTLITRLELIGTSFGSLKYSLGLSYKDFGNIDGGAEYGSVEATGFVLSARNKKAVLEYVNVTSDAGSVLSTGDDWEANISGCYLSLLGEGQPYMKFKVGKIKQEMVLTTGAGSTTAETTSVTSYGIGLGYKIGTRISVELDITTLDNDMTLMALSVLF